MCHFHASVGIRGKGIEYLNAKERKAALKAGMNPDSHEDICKIRGYQTDKVSHIEWNPLTRKITQRKPAFDGYVPDEEEIIREMDCIDYRKLCKLVIKPFINPLTGVDFRGKVTKGDLQLLASWASVVASVRASAGDSVGASVWASVWDSVRASVGASAGASVGDSVGASVWDSVWDSVRASVGDSVRASVWDSVRASVGASVWAYVGTFFDIKYKVDITPSNKLWSRGLVPSFDGKTWRLHSGPQAKIVWQGTVEELKRQIKGK